MMSNNKIIKLFLLKNKRILTKYKKNNNECKKY